MDELSQLEELLAAGLDDNPTVKESADQSSIMKEVDLFSIQDNPEDETQIIPNKNKSDIHTGDTDSSDDEERRNYTERKYDAYGSQVKKSLDNQLMEQKHRMLDFETRLRNTNNETKLARSNSFLSKPEPVQQKIQNAFCIQEAKSKSTDVYTDPIFGIRIVKPIISSSVLLDRMQGREAINMLRMKRHVENEDLSSDWVTAGVIVKKSATKQSQKGSQFLIWTLSDLKDDLKTVSLFLFRKAYSELWKTSESTVVAILNPNVLDKSQNSSDQACLSVDKPDKIMVLGQSKDLGICKSKKKNGEPCTAFINLSQCEHCIYHVKQEYQKFARRQELQSSTMGKGLVNLQNKVLGKTTMIYGGKAYSALPTGNSKKVKKEDQNRLMTLSDYYKTENNALMINKSPYGADKQKFDSGILHSPSAARINDNERLNKLSGTFNNISPKSNIKEMSLAEKVANSPQLGRGFSLKGPSTIDLNIPYGQKAAERSKANAIKLIQKRGGINKADPHNLRGTEAGKKRALEKLNGSNELNEENSSKKNKPSTLDKKPKGVMTERFKKILEATSAHQNLIEQHEDEEQEKYFNKLEKKESMEEKMLNTFKLACKAVRCVKCKYTAFSASQKCKDEKHPLKVLDTFKRFFKCGNCSNRTVSLDIIPLHSCGNCNSSKWEKAPMMREKKVTTLSDGLSIRGEEETFIGGQVTAGKNINLLVPDS